MTTDGALIEGVARSLFDAENEWREMQDGLQGPSMGERAFKVAIAEWKMKARAALSAIQQHAEDNGGFLDLGDGWVICKHRAPDAVSEAEAAEIERRALLASRPRVDG